MYIDAWLPRGYLLPDGRSSGTVLHASSDWQIISTNLGTALVVEVDLADRWESMKLITMHPRFSFGGSRYGMISSPTGKQLIPFDALSTPKSLDEIQSMIDAYQNTRSVIPHERLSDCIYLEDQLRLLPTFKRQGHIDDALLIGRWICGGLNVSLKNTFRIKQATGWLSESEILFIQQECGVLPDETEHPNDHFPTSEAKVGQTRPSLFCLPGRRELENFFREHIIEVIENPVPYKTMGIDFPASFILHGPPGCGKTHAAGTLVKYLGWRQYHVNSSSVASPYVHDTSKKISDVFARAIANAPAAIIIDEMESFLSDRGMSSDGHHVEEMAEFLRRIPEARENHVLIIAMTNRIDMIDPAILRRGRFDHIIEVGYASQQEVFELLRSLLQEIPVETNLKLEELAKELVGRPLSDVAFIVREGARLAARSGKLILARDHLNRAIASLTKE